MATILQFRRAEPTGEVMPQPRLCQTSAAEIIIFPGVRIDRNFKSADANSNMQSHLRRPAQGE